MTLFDIIGLSLISLVFVILLIPILRSHSLLPGKSTNTSSEFEGKGKENDDELAKSYFQQSLKPAKKEMRIVSGALYPGVYDKGIANEVRTCLQKKPKLKVRILVGPKVLLNKESGKSPFWEIYKSGDFQDRFEIRVLPKYPEEHFRVTDMTGIYWEKPHETKQTRRMVNMNFSSYTNAPIYALEFDKAWNKVDTAREPEFQVVN